MYSLSPSFFFFFFFFFLPLFALDLLYPCFGSGGLLLLWIVFDTIWPHEWAMGYESMRTTTSIVMTGRRFGEHLLCCYSNLHPVDHNILGRPRKIVQYDTDDLLSLTFLFPQVTR
jgi:hypothetical protein